MQSIELKTQRCPVTRRTKNLPNEPLKGTDSVRGIHKLNGFFLLVTGRLGRNSSPSACAQHLLSPTRSETC